MVKIYFTDSKKKKSFIDISFWSLLKNYVLVILASAGIIYGAILVILLIVWVISWIAGLIF